MHDREGSTYALLHEDTELALILNLDELLAAIGRVADVQLSKSPSQQIVYLETRRESIFSDASVVEQQHSTSRQKQHIRRDRLTVSSYLHLASCGGASLLDLALLEVSMRMVGGLQNCRRNRESVCR